MKDRGVTRPMAQSHKKKKKKASGAGQPPSRMDKLVSHHKKTLWIYWTLIGLGLWLMVAPFTFGYLNSEIWVDPSGGRGVWFSDKTYTELRAWLMTWSDVISGALVVLFGWRSLKPNRPKSLWACCFVGVWLTFAPILFWSPLSSAYLNDTIVGMALIALTILIPGMPNMMMYMKMGPANPEGWSYNPSSWPQRWIMILLGFIGFVVSRYLTTFQLGYTDHVWDPFFGFASGTRAVLNSKMSHMWPISDAGLGAISYTFEFLMGWMGSPARWRTMPWMVAFFGILVIPLGLTHILLVISQPVIVGHWCTMCLLAAAIMLPMIPLEVDEVFAMFQHMKKAKARGDRKGSMWKVFWLGGEAKGSAEDERSPDLQSLPDQKLKVFKSSLWGFSSPWTLSLAVLFGIWAMFSPTVFGAAKPLSDIFHVAGALTITVSVIAMGELIRLFRYLNIPLGLTLIFAPWFIGDASTGLFINGAVTGLLVIALSIPRGVIRERYGIFQHWVR